MTIFKPLYALLIFASTVTISVAENLTQIYQDALNYDPVLKASEANYQAIQENHHLALSALKPQVSLSGTTSYNVSHTNNTFQEGFSNTYNACYTLSVKNHSTAKI